MKEYKKNYKKAILSFALILAMVFSVLPTKVYASEKNTPTRTTMLDVSKLTETTDMLESEGWKWVPTDSGGTLTLRNCYIQSQNASSLKLPDGNVTIRLEGENTIETMSTSWNAMIWSDTVNSVVALNTTIVAGTKDGKLNILRNDVSSITAPYAFAGNAINILSGSIYVNTEFCIIKSDFTMQGGALVIDVANIPDGNGIYTVEGNVNISGGTLDIDAGQIGVFIPGNTNIGGQKVSLTGGDVKIRSGLAGIFAKNITVNTNGNLDLQGNTTALYCSKADGVLEILAAGSLTLSGEKPYLPESTSDEKTVIIDDADYTAVDVAITKAEALNHNDYVSDLTNVKAAVDAVVTGKKVLEQNIVNGYAITIENAIKALEYKAADYSKVDAAIAKIPSDLSLYTKESMKVLNDAKDAVIRGKNITEQATVDSYAITIENAIKNLNMKSVVSITNPKTGIKMEYNDGTLLAPDIVLSVIPMTQEEMDKFKNAINEIARGSVLLGLYDISLLKDGIAIQPNGKVKISIPLTNAMKSMTDLQVIYVNDNGSITIFPSEVRDGKIVFVTDHFSYYGVIGEMKDNTIGDKNSTNKSPQTGDSSSIMLFMITIFVSGVSLVIFTKKRKMSKD